MRVNAVPLEVGSLVAATLDGETLNGVVSGFRNLDVIVLWSGEEYDETDRGHVVDHSLLLYAMHVHDMAAMGLAPGAL